MSVQAQTEESIFYAASKITDLAQRKLFLDQACAGDTDLFKTVEALLSTQEDAEKFFAESGSALKPPTNQLQQSAAEAVGDYLEEKPGTMVGRYKLLQKIGEGGCGVVYMAEQEVPVRRKVALKVIKLGMDTRSVIARFEAERQALALMDHPNIARVLDAGATETGRPYFVMELVRGFKLTQYCDENHLDTEQRLDLFVPVCQAIQHAHHKGIIHRDIKPSNILVTLHDGVPVPKVIDFGIAKATQARLTDKTLFTAYEQLIGTPAYMSPEQAEMSGLDVDTRSDIYSLGVLLYELLTGRTPFDPKELVRSGLDEMRRTLREREPQRPSTIVTTMHGTELRATAEHRHAEPPRLISMLRGDLDWIVMKALEKDRTRRYQTANAVAMDLQRHLNNEPVLARPPSRLYRFQKLVRRNRGVFATVAAVAFALLAGFGTSTYLFFKERDARQRAVAAEQKQLELREEAERRQRVTQAAFLVSQERFEEADQLLATVSVFQPSMEAAAMFRGLGQWYALRKDWRPSSERFASLITVNQFEGWDIATLDFLACGTALCEAGDQAGYQRLQRAAVERFRGTTNKVVAERILKTTLLLPGSEKQLDGLPTLADVAAGDFSGVDEDPDQNDFRDAWRSISVALWEYRLGNFNKANEWCKHCLTFSEDIPPRSAAAKIIQAMCLYQLHHDAAAHEQLQQVRELIENRFKAELDLGDRERGFWFDWVFAHVLLKQAAALLPPASKANTGSISP
jgi:serine/threonine protein kinase